MNNLSTKGIDGVEIKNTMKEHVTKEQIIEWISTKVHGLPNYEALKYNPELVLYIGSCIEIATKENGVKTEKLEVYMAVYKRLFDLTANDEVIIINQLEFLLKNCMIKGKVKISFKSILKFLLKIIPALTS
jgi:hypothetical protein